MRKFVLLAVLAAVVCSVWSVESEASWRRRRACYSSYYIWSPCPTGPTTAYATRLPSKAVLATETITTPRGRMHRLHTIDDVGWQEPKRERTVRRAPTAARARAAADEDIFDGNDREAAKTSTSSAMTVTYADLATLIGTLPDDDFMRNQHMPRISKDQNSGRVDEEQRNVAVVAYLVASKKENDNDYHLILATTPWGDGPYLTAEVSGLPRMGTEEDANRLADAREQYRQLLRGRMPGSRYKVFDPPLAVSVAGSLFYDMDHVAGVVGTGDYKPDTSWEIHPVTSITHAQ
jgi:hypothetical protein